MAWLSERRGRMRSALRFVGGLAELPPGVAYRSMRLSVRHARPWAALELPIVAAWTSSFVARPTARVELGGTLFLGWSPQEGDGHGHPGRVAVELQRGASFRTDGWVLFGAGSDVLVGTDADLRIGASTYFTRDATIDCRIRLHVGGDCAIAPGVVIMDNDAHALYVEGTPRPAAPIDIGEHVWIGTRAIILKGVSVGDGAVIGAGAVVTRDVPPASIVAGNPARIVRKHVEWW
jgi:hypothetical protein